MKIGILVTASKNSGGIYQYTSSILKALHDWDTNHEFVIIRFQGNQLPLYDFSGSRWSILTIDHQMAQCENIAQYLSGDGLDLICSNINPGMKNFFKDHRIELIISPAPVSLLFEWGMPYIMAIHDLQHRLQPKFPEVSAGNIWKSREYLFRNGVRYAKAILVDSEIGKEDVLNFYGDYISPDKVYPLPFLPFYRPDDSKTSEIGKRKIREKYNLPNNFLFYPSQFWLHKNHSRLIHAVHILQAVHKVAVPVVLVGDNSAGMERRDLVYKNAITLAEQLGVKNLVHYLGYVPDEDMAFLYSMAKALTMPTFFGPTNIPFLEAWAFGCPIITSNIRGIREQVETAGLLIDPENAYEMAEGILKLWTDNRSRRTLIAAGYEKINSYSSNDFAQRLYKTIEEVRRKIQIGGSANYQKIDRNRGQEEQNGWTDKRQDRREIGSPERLYQTAQGFMEGGREKEAIGALRVLLEVYSDYALAHNDLGVLYYNEGNKEKALKHYEQAAQLEPNNLTFQKNLADIYYFELDRIAEALKIYNIILTENPEDLETLLAMGHICINLDKIDDAIDFYNRVLEIDSGNANAIEMLRQIRKMVAQFFLDKTHEDLSEHYTPEYGSTHRKILASSLKDHPLSDDEQAFLDTLTAKMKSVEKSPEAIPSLLASMLYYYPHQLPIAADILEVPEWLQEDYCVFLLSYPRCFSKQGEVNDYCRHIIRVFESFYKSIQGAPNSEPLQKLANIFTQKAYFIPLYFSNENLTDLYLHRAAIAESSLKTQGYELEFTLPPRPEERKKLRLGIYSKVLAPSTEAFATLPVYEYLNREEFEVFLYVHQQNGNPVELHARQLADRFIELPKDMKASVDIIRTDNLDVLFFSNNLTAVMNHAFILANHRLARFQCVHFCQPVTTGLKHIDAFFLGSVMQKKGKEEERYHEQIVNLEGSGIYFDLRSSKAPPAAAKSREQIGIPENSVVFASGANFFKIIPELRHLWARLLEKVPESVLVLYPFGLAWSASYPKTAFRDHFERILTKYDVKKDRLIVLDPFPTREDIKELLKITDVYLDAVPYSGATSLLDPLEVGVPTVVMEGDELRCRQGAAILKELEVEELVVKSEEEYIELASKMATDKEFRSDLREKILNKMKDTPPFLDPKGYAEKIGAALKNMVYG